MSNISVEEALKLLEPQPVGYVSTQTSKYLRWYDKEMRCTSKRCGSPTYLKIQGSPKCMIHAIHELDELLNKLTQDRG